jgi:hypothetical protein
VNACVLLWMRACCCECMRVVVNECVRVIVNACVSLWMRASRCECMRVFVNACVCVTKWCANAFLFKSGLWSLADMCLSFSSMTVVSVVLSLISLVCSPFDFYLLCLFISYQLSRFRVSRSTSVYQHIEGAYNVLGLALYHQTLMLLHVYFFFFFFFFIFFFIFSQPSSYNQQASCLTTPCALSAVPPLQANIYCNAMRLVVVVVAVPLVRPDFGLFLAGM